MSHRNTLVCFAMKIHLLIYVPDDAVPRMYAALSSWFIFHGKPYFSDATIALGDDRNYNWYKSQWGEHPLLFFWGGF